MATRPNKGAVESVTHQNVPAPPPAPAAGPPWGSYRNGLWRPNHDFGANFGVRIAMRNEPGVTRGDILRVPLRFQTPVTEELHRPYQFTWATFDTIRAGQGTRPQGRQLLQVQLTTLLLDAPAMDATTGTVIWSDAPHPQLVLDELRWIMGQTPGSQADVFRLVLSQPAVWSGRAILNILATIIALEPVQHPDEVGTEYLSITFQQFPENELVGRQQRPQSHGPARWTLHSGDTLYEIAKRSHFHQPSAWKAIAKANGIAGVSPNSASDLAGWARKHHKTQLTIPAKGRA